jgi:hypothetical protein
VQRLKEKPMTQIARIFDSSKNATEAANELKANNFSNLRLATEPVANDLYAGALKNGGAVLYVELPFGRGRLVEQILDRHGPSQPLPSQSRVSAEARSRMDGDGKDVKAAPFSSLLGLPVLTDPQPTTVSSLGDQRPTFPTGLLRSDFYLSRLFGLPLLTPSKAWASLIHDPAPLSTWLGVPVLLNDGRRPPEADSEPSSLNASEFG